MEPPNVTCLQGPSGFFSREAFDWGRWLIPLLIRGGEVPQTPARLGKQRFQLPKDALVMAGQPNPPLTYPPPGNKALLQAC